MDSLMSAGDRDADNAALEVSHPLGGGGSISQGVAVVIWFLVFP